jgi:hypothetical protein
MASGTARMNNARTSATHPLQIASVSAGVGLGSVGLTFCPGKHQANAATGAWARDLRTDVQAIAAWGASTIVTLVEDHELVDLKVSALGPAVAAAKMEWRHLPIRDVSVPDAAFEAAWRRVSPDLRDQLRAGDACVGYAQLLADAISGVPKGEVLSRARNAGSFAIADILGGSWRGKRRDQIKSSGYVAHSLEAALWCVARTSSFSSAVLLAANLGDGADTVAAITGQLVGALYGASGMPAAWLKRLAWRDQLQAAADALIDAGAAA